MDLMDVLRADRALTVVRADRIPDPVALASALADGGIRTVELTFTTPGVLDHIAAAAGAGVLIGAGTVMSAEQARAAIDSGARFLVTPGLRPAVAEVAVAAGVPVFLGAFTPTEVATALDMGAAAVKIFPAGRLGPKYLSDLRGPYPGIGLVPSGGLSADNAAEYLAAGALAVSAGTSVVPPAVVEAGEWAEITARARTFAAAIAAT
ncbi:bifunctional 4-hydroxy-2-oxoglutarate aldolase/2-dehydro-3-deoxy-phosphogluconate aldolase [Actinomycetes bacterium KLBMP 9759]